MKRLLFSLLFWPALALAQVVPPAPSVAAKSYVLLDFFSLQVLGGNGVHERIEPASLTKLMTAYLTFSALKQNHLTLEQVLPVSQQAWRAQGSRMFVEPNKPVTVEELMKGMIVQSGNDASIALAEGVAGTEEAFAEMMNREAARLGMKNTHFTNSTGLPHAQHYSTAYDLALLAAAIIRDFPDNYALYSMKEYKYNNISQPNRNRLLFTDPYVDGVKTGFTENAGYCLISSAKRGTQRLISVVSGAATNSARFSESQKLLNYGFQNYETVRLYERGQVLSTLPVWKGAAESVQAVAGQDLFLTLAKGQRERMQASLESQQPLFAPISAGDKIGTLKLTLDGKPAAEVPAVALQTVPIASFFGRVWDSLRLYMK
jgi:serine-type D-Ala-D-Ala carboxypeptidase (penicillin-binding protein 5/6)